MTGLVAVIAVALPALSAVFTGDALIDGPAAVWWAGYLLFLAVFVIDARWRSVLPSWVRDDHVIVVEVVLAVAIYLTSVRYGWSGILFVITAASAAFIWPIRVVAAIVIGQSAIVAFGLAAAGESLDGVVISTVAYAAFQAFAALMVHMLRREASARAELAAAHAELRASSALLAESSRATERLRIARDLHDLMGHQLTALSLELEVASHHADTPALDHVSRARGISKDLLSSVRTAVDQLRQPSDGIAATLRAMVDGIASPEVDLRVIEEASLSDEQAQVIVRCVQEIVTNTIRHADARHLSITTTVTDRGVGIEAHDDGVGADHLRPGNGLAGMRERLEQLSGSLKVETSAGQGFTVIARVPAP